MQFQNDPLCDQKWATLLSKTVYFAIQNGPLCEIRKKYSTLYLLNRFFHYLCLHIMRLSIIIPVYNVKGTLRRCIDSILKMDMGDYEIVLVDDGSTDGSSELCDEMAQGTNRIRVIHQQNRGLSAARNTGLKRSHSEYVTFVDSDDFLDSQTFPKLMAILRVHTEYDILEYPAVIAYGSQHQHRLALGKKEYSDMKQYWIEGQAYAHAYAWNKVYRRELFSGIRFPEGKAFEDVFALPLVLERAQTVATTSQGTYYYCYNDKGITATAGSKELSDLLEAHKVYIETYTNKDDWHTREFATYFTHVLNILLDAVSDDRIWKEVAQHTPSTSLKLTLMKLCGISFLRRINTLWHKIIPRKHF